MGADAIDGDEDDGEAKSWVKVAVGDRALQGSFILIAEAAADAFPRRATRQ
ncbi:hypothetical protein IT072_03260 [Leifsonia sp. ZF2019]|uniref:hypothetical protein n=1 Tax=Leifsonia sp. ZF2019 TaxID=2781978 RepID=UPI001CC0B3A4|nr:hypothetical protein [Leifsonia sp. ZF2019]UAJ80090.1 hypothetical protein IT072_03260 [Leifsonia sp. ZF2019]